MQPLVPIFMRHAAASSAEQSHGSQTDKKTEVAGRGHLTLEFRDNPFESLVRQVEKLIDRDPKEALRLLKMTLSGKLFSAPRELQRLGDKLDETLLKLQTMKPETFDAPALQSVFGRGAFGLPAPSPLGEGRGEGLQAQNQMSLTLPAMRVPSLSQGRGSAAPGADLSSLAA